MVIQQPGPLSDAAFVTSDSPIDHGRLEVDAWMTDSNCVPSEPNRIFAIFQQGEIVREWNLIRKLPRN